MGQRPSRTSPELFVQHNNAPPDDAQRVIRRQSGTLHDVNVENLFHARGEVINESITQCFTHLFGGLRQNHRTSPETSMRGPVHLSYMVEDLAIFLPSFVDMPMSIEIIRVPSGKPHGIGILVPRHQPMSTGPEHLRSLAQLGHGDTTFSVEHSRQGIRRHLHCLSQ